jgi:hypothetical protein
MCLPLPCDALQAAAAADEAEDAGDAIKSKLL